MGIFSSVPFFGDGESDIVLKTPKYQKSGKDQRAYWVEKLAQITLPVMDALSNDRIKDLMPVETSPGAGNDRSKVTYLEALGRSIAGLAPWLELDKAEETESSLRKKLLDHSLQAISNAVNPSAASFMNFNVGGQPLVDAAFLAHGLLRAPRSLWGNLDTATRENIVRCLRSTRVIKPHYSNWLLFTAMIEAALLKFSGEWDVVRVDYAVKEHGNWYQGDGMYGDGPEFHFDYYNSFVIQPMLLDILKVVNEETGTLGGEWQSAKKRAVRYSEILERQISPEGTFPPVGRSLAYRCGAFQLLAQIALQKLLPPVLAPSQVRCALTAVIERTLDVDGTFDKNGWLQIGLSGHQPQIGEPYISTGSLYLCSTAFLPLGLPASDAFWSGLSEDWTSRKAFGGKPFPIDKAI